MGCFCDYDPAEFVQSEERTARKPHKCCECGHQIEPGEVYEHVRGKWGGEISTFDTCEMCVELREALSDYYGGCFQYGGLQEEYHEYLNETLRGDLTAHDVCAGIFRKHMAGPNDKGVGAAR